MKTKSKSEKLDELSESIQEISEISCDECLSEDNTPEDVDHAVKTFFANGWRVIDDKTLCRRCVRKLRKPLIKNKNQNHGSKTRITNR